MEITRKWLAVPVVDIAASGQSVRNRRYLNGRTHEEVDTDRQCQHVDRLWQVLRYEPCSPTCAKAAGQPSPDLSATHDSTAA
jgi:hypothetical protein